MVDQAQGSVAAKKLIVPTVQPVGPLKVLKPKGFGLLYGSAFRPVGRVPWRPLPKSKYIQSPFGVVSPSYQPAILHEAAYLKWFSKLARPRGITMSTRDYLLASEVLLTEFGPFVLGGLSTIDEVLPDIDWDKSPGWPYVNEGCSTKREAWDKFQEVITQRAHDMINGVYVECLFIATLKDELVVSGKQPRVFLPAPFHHQLACAMLFKKACDSLTASCHRHSSAIGMNVFGRGLERSLRRLSDLPYGFDADQSGCDTSCKDSEPERDFMKIGLPPVYHSGVDLLFNTAMCPSVIVGDSVLSLVLNPSGWYLTTVINTLMTHRTVALAYLDMFPDQGISEMRERLLQCNGGDDLAYSTSEPDFNIVALANSVAKRGMYLESDVLEPRNPMNLTFYSHNLYLRKLDSTNSYIYVACGRLSKILSAFSYLKIVKGEINWFRAASRAVGLMYNLWPYKVEYDIMYPYLYHMVHHFFLLSGGVLDSGWSGVFKSLPTDDIMMSIRSGAKREASFVFSSLPTLSSPVTGKSRVFQSALRSSLRSTTNTNTMSRKIDAVLDKLEKQSTLSPDGRAWLIASCDPFHDSDIRLAGYPDVATSATVVQLVKKQLQVTVPTTGNGSVTLGNNWDCSIALFPQLVNEEYGNLSTIDPDGNGSGASVNGVYFGGLCVNSGPQAERLWPDTTDANAAVTPQFIGAQEYCKGMVRIIGMGFEVVNTTADINKQGQVTAWRMPNLATETNTYWPSGLVAPAVQTTRVVIQRMPPSTIASASLLYGSRSWAAREGAYVVSRQSGVNNPFQFPSNTPIVYTMDDMASGNTDTWITSSGLAAGGVVNNGDADIYAPFDISGVHFTGLSYATTLTVNVRWLIERVPSPLEPDLVVLATPSASYDPLALELYTHCLRDMPPGVMLNENPLGEWFRSALSKVADYAPKIGSFLGNVIPGASTLGNVIGGAARVGSNLIPAPKREEKIALQDSASNMAPQKQSLSNNKPKQKKKKPSLPSTRLGRALKYRK